jgi:homoserine kinase
VGLSLHPSLHPVAFIPSSGKQSTRSARSLLPEQVSHQDAVRTAGRAALLVQALATHPELLLPATVDGLHQPFRLAAQPRGAALLARLREAGVAATLSGSGPSVLALATGPEQAAMAQTLATRGWSALALAVDTEGATLLAG